ncbi:MAG: malate dehydrogenase [Planctomycetes bacterium]|nr:malate dehydrogenase [Planctomycetota bacterium]
MIMPKVSIIGAGNVGASAALRLAERDVADIVMVDIVEGLPQGKALDMVQAAPLAAFSVGITGTTNQYESISGSDVVIVTSGLPRKPGMTREDLLKVNADIVSKVTQQVVKYAPKCVLLMLTNPLDLMTYHAWKVSGFPAQRVLGQSGVLDSARFSTFVAEALGISPADVTAMVMGGHGDTMVPLPRYTTVSGISVVDLLPAEQIGRIAQRTRDGGAEIVNLMKTSGYYAAGASLAKMAEAIVRDQKRILPASAYLTGQYGIRDLYIGVPIKLGAGGVEQILELKLTDAELGELRKSAGFYKEQLKVLGY